MDNKKKILEFINNWIKIDNYHRRKLVKSKGDNSPHSQPLQLSNHETTSSSSLFHHRWSWTVIKSRPEEHSNTKSGGGADQAWGKEKGGIGIMERRNSRLVDPNYSLRSILTIHRSSCGKSSFLVPWILFTGCLCPKGMIVWEPGEGKNGRVAGGGLSLSSPARLSNFSMRV